MEADIDVPYEQKREGSYRHTSKVSVDDPEIADLVRTAAAARWVSLSPYRTGPDESVRAFTELTTLADRETLFVLLGHESPVLRGHLAGHIVDALPAHMERLYPLLHDDRPLDTLAGCFLGWTRVGSYAARCIGYAARREDECRREWTANDRGSALALLMRAARDATLPMTVRGAVVEALACADVPDAEPVLRECLACHEPALLHASLSGLAQLPEADRWPILRALRDHPSAKLRARALEVGAELASPDLTEACERVLRDDPDAMLRRLALMNLPHPSPLSIEGVRAAVRDADRYVAEAALRWLIEEDAEAAALLVCEGITRPDEHIEMGDMGRLALRRSGPAAEVVARHAVALDGGLAAERRDLIGEALDCVGERHLLDCLGHVRRHLASPDAYVADRAACAAGRLGDHGSIEAMEALLVAKEWRAREGAAEGLAALGSVRSLTLLKAALEGVVPVTRQVIEAAIAGLEATGEPPA